MPMTLINKMLFNRMVWSVAAVTLAAAVATPPAAAQDAATVEKGKAVYAAQKCSVCHTIAGSGNKSSPLDGVGKKLTVDQIREWIVDPKAATAKAKSTKKPLMPEKYSKLPAADLDALVAYMASLK
jgi:mono/diheme cytochrome c family protein